MSWLYIAIARLAMGERWRKATPAEQRYYAGLFFIIPTCFEIGIFAIKYAEPVGQLLDRGGVRAFWLAFALGTSVLFFGSWFWGKHVPTKISVALAIAAWLVLILTLVHYDFLWNLK